MSTSRLDRRTFLVGAGLTLTACGSPARSTVADATTAQPSTTADPTTSTSTSVDPTTSTDSGAVVESSTTDVADAPGSSSWASGRTDLITVDYPSDDIFDAAGACAIALSTAIAEGPCYYAEDTGEDISAGRTGLPMQLCFRLIDADCQPVPGHLVEVWHSDTEGLYSGDTSESADADRFAGDFCTAGDENAVASTFFRGQLTSNASGRVNFKTCFPGWYAGRTIHFHIAVSDPSGNRRIVSQLCFADEVVTEITTGHELYAARGDQDTPLAGGTDRFFPSRGGEEFIITTRKNEDGTLLGFHSIQVS